MRMEWFAVGVLLWGATATCVGDEVRRLPIYERAVFFYQKIGETEQLEFSSGLVLAHREALYFVTAAHSARQYDQRLQLGIPVGDETGWWPTAGELLKDVRGWTHHPRDDVAVALIRSDLEKSRKANLQAIAVPSSAIETEPVPRGTSIYTCGFPQLIGVQPNHYLASVSVPGQTASAPIRLPRANPECRFYLAVPTCSKGTSGGPVFAGELSKATPSAAPAASVPEPKLLGTYFGVMSPDETGAKLAIVVPAKGILDLIPAQP